MAAAVSLARTFEPLVRPVRVAADETWIAPCALDRAAAETRIRELVAPYLAHREDKGELVARITPTLLHVPFWRVKLAVPAAYLSRSSRTIAIGNIEFPMPAPAFGGRAGVLMISARTVVPYVPRLPFFFGGAEGDALEVHRSDLLPMTNDVARSLVSEGEIVDADVDRATGEDLAVDTLLSLLQRPGMVRFVFSPTVESALFVRYPLYHARFGPDDAHFVLLSGRDGKVVSAHYPRPPTISERVKRFFSG